MPEYTQMNPQQQRQVILNHLQNAEAQHLNLTMNALVNEECAKLCDVDGNAKDANEYRAAAAKQRREAEAFLRGAELLKTQYAELLAPDGPAATAPVRIA